MIVTESLEIPIYGRRLHIIISGDFIKDYPEINKKFNQEFTQEDNVLGMSQGRTGHSLIIVNVGRHRTIFPKAKVEIEIADTIGHECVHTCNRLFSNIGATLDQDNDEPQAYLVGWLIKQVTKNYLKFKAQEDVKKI
jgi:hypothetical protein